MRKCFKVAFATKSGRQFRNIHTCKLCFFTKEVSKTFPIIIISSTVTKAFVLRIAWVLFMKDFNRLMPRTRQLSCQNPAPKKHKLLNLKFKACSFESTSFGDNCENGKELDNSDKASAQRQVVKRTYNHVPAQQ